MVDVMNQAGIDIVTFGNHEFDLGLEDLQMRLDESEFRWVSSNVLQNKEKGIKSFYKNKNDKRSKKEKIPETIIQTFTDEDGTSVTVGFFGVTLDEKQQPYLTYKDPIQRSKAMVEELDSKVDLIIPICNEGNQILKLMKKNSLKNQVFILAVFKELKMNFKPHKTTIPYKRIFIIHKF